MCTHQGAGFLEAQLASIASQTSPCQALIIHDWGSRDETRAILSRFKQKYSENLAISISIHSEAPGPAQSYLIALSDTLSKRDDFDYLMFCDQDDLWLPEKLARFREAIIQEQCPDLVYSDFSLIDAYDRELRQSVLRRPVNLLHPSSLVLNLVPGMAMAVSREFLRRCSELWAMSGWLMHDFAVCIAIYLTGSRSYFIPENLTAYRQHRSSYTCARGAIRKLLQPLDLIHRARRYVVGVHSQYQGPVRAAANALNVRLPLTVLDRWTIDRIISSSRSVSYITRLPYRAAFLLFTKEN